MSSLEIRHKNRARLEQQVQSATQRLAMSLIPESKPDIFSFDQTQLKQLYPIRFGLYLSVLRNRDVSPESTRKLQLLNSLDRYIAWHHNEFENRTLREGQLDVFEDLRLFIERGGINGYIKLPTGSGKTVIFSEFIEATGMRTIIVVPTKILVEQTEDRLKEFATNVDVGKVYSREKDWSKEVTVTTYSSLTQAVQNGEISTDDYDLLILDEAHRSLSDKRINVVNSFTNALKLGFTATPDFSKNKRVRNLLPTEIHSMPIREAAETGVVSSFSVFTAKTDIDMTNVSVTSRGEYSENDLEKAVNIASRNIAAVSLYEEIFTGAKAVSYCVSIKHANDLANLFLSKGISAAVIHGKQSKTEQRKLLQGFREGKVKVVCNADILIEGFDDPSVTVCLNLRPTLSPVLAEQRGGRVLRLDPTNPEKHAYIVDFIDNIPQSKNAPITFAEVVGSAEITNISKSRGIGADGNRPTFDPIIHISGLVVSTNPEEVMRVVNELKEDQYSLPPQDWINISNLSKEVGKQIYTIKVHIDKFRQDHPNWFRRFVSQRGTVKEYFSPELANIIRQEMNSKLPKPEGWEINFTISTRLKRGERTVEKIANKYRIDHPEWFGFFASPTRPINEYYSPELIARIEAELGQPIPPPDNWLHLEDVSRKLQISVHRLKHALQILDPEQKDWGRYNGFKRNATYLNPSIINEVEGKFSVTSSQPDGWIGLTRAFRELKSDRLVVKRIISLIKAEHSEWAGNYVSASGAVIEFYSPELINELRKRLNKV